MVVSVNRVFSRLRMRQLSLLIALDQHRSLRRAASELAMTQSAASKALVEIEAIVGAPLFDRSHTGIEPNEMGACIIRYAWLLRADVQSMCEEINNIELGRTGQLSIGTIMGGVPRVMSEAVLAMRRLEPDISIKIVEDTSAKLLDELDQGNLDIVIGRIMVSPNPLHYKYVPLWNEPLNLAVGANHPLAKRKRLELRDLEAFGWIVYPSLMPLRALLERAMSDAGMVMPANIIETASTFATVSLLSQDASLIALLPADVCRFFSAEKLLRILPLELASANPPFGIVTRAGTVPTALAKRFAAILEDLSVATDWPLFSQQSRQLQETR